MAKSSNYRDWRLEKDWDCVETVQLILKSNLLFALWSNVSHTFLLDDASESKIISYMYSLEVDFYFSFMKHFRNAFPDDNKRSKAICAEACNSANAELIANMKHFRAILHTVKNGKARAIYGDDTLSYEFAQNIIKFNQAKSSKKSKSR